MSETGVIRVDSWKVVCQECRETHENGNDWPVFADRWSAEDEARDFDWAIRGELVICPNCVERRPVCLDHDEKCTRRDVSEADDGRLYCPDHLAQGMDAPTGAAS